ncbi:uncharacterized, partial [Tachysurus ichikawai]
MTNLHSSPGLKKSGFYIQEEDMEKTGA